MLMRSTQMLNPATEKLVINNFMVGYTMLYAQHNFYLDEDVVSKVVFYKTGTQQEKIEYFPATEKLYTYFTLKNLLSNSSYTLNAAFYDAMASDPSLVGAKLGINLSETLSFTTAKSPSFTNIEVIATHVDVGVSDPTVVFSLNGYGQTVIIQAQKEGTTDWLTVFDGAFSDKINVIVPIGNYKFRVAGRIRLPDGLSLDISTWYQFPTTIAVSYLAVPPTTPTNLVFKAAKIKDGIERYDVQVSWTWERLSGAQVKEFILQYVTTEEYSKTGWAKASVINNASAKSVIITSFPHNKQYTFRVGVSSWGQNTVWSSTSAYIIDANTVFDQAITTVSGCEIGYYGIRAFIKEGASYKQSFLLDANTGGMSIGVADSEGKIPFVFDPTNKVLNIDGKTITEEINAANFVLTNLGTGSPKLYSQEKPYYSAANSGIFFGRDSNGLMQFDVGNNVSYLRFDGNDVRISGSVVISTNSGDVPLDDAMQGKNVAFIYKTSTTTPATPTSTSYPPSGWATNPTATPCWISQGQIDPATGSLISGTSWSTPIKFSGADGVRGPGIYAYAISGLYGWSDSYATTFFSNNFGTGPVKYDVLTEYNSTNPSVAYTKMWTGSTWTTPALTVHGDMIVDGTVRAQSLAADAAFLAKAGIDIIYDKTAALSATPESSYKMKIDLANGLIHIR